MGSFLSGSLRHGSAIAHNFVFRALNRP